MISIPRVEPDGRLRCMSTMTALESAVFDPGWQTAMGIGYHNLQWATTGERVTAESFARYRGIGGGVIIHSIPDAAVQAALASPFVMIASDGGLTDGKGHPRSTGAYARVLGRYVREAHALSLMDVIRRMSLMPAERLQDRVPMMRNKGRIRVGADADLTLFGADASSYALRAGQRRTGGARWAIAAGRARPPRACAAALRRARRWW